MELLAVFLVVFLIGVQVGQLLATWTMLYAIAKLIKVMTRGNRTNLMYRLPGEVLDNDNDG